MEAVSLALLRCYLSPASFNSSFICILGQVFLIYLLAMNHRFSVDFRSDKLAGMAKECDICSTFSFQTIFY